jgi:hypothetical protein
VTAAARSVRAVVRSLAAVVALVLGIAAIEYAAQHTAVGLLLAVALVAVYAIVARSQRS